MAKPKIIGHPWDFCVLWNQALAAVPEKPLIKREHIWASELGGSYVDRYLKMNAVPMTNPPNARSRRKFHSGHVFEWIVGMVLTTVGVLKQKQLRTEVELPGLLKVTGKLDFIAGGEVDWEKSYYELNRLKALFSQSYDDAPAFIMFAAEHILNAMKKKFDGKPLMELVFECKSVASRMLEKIERVGAMPHNVLQCGHYLIGNKMPLAQITYISKDDCLMAGFNIENNRRLATAYKDDVAMMTDFFQARNKTNPVKTRPPIEPELLFDDVMYRFEKNFKVEYSSYLKMLYGYDQPDDYDRKWKGSIASWNRAFKRIVRGETIQQKTKDSMTELKKIFPDLDMYIQKAKKEGVFTDNEDY